MIYALIAIVDLIAQPLVGNAPLNVTVTCNGVVTQKSLTASTTISCANGTTGNVELNWDMPTKNDDGSTLLAASIVGYRVYYGTISATLDKTLDIAGGLTLTTTIAGLANGTYYFAMTTRTSNDESKHTSVANKTIGDGTPPPIDPPPVDPPPTSGTMVCACNELNGDRANFGAADQFAGCTFWRWMIPVGGSYVRNDSSEFWLPYGPLASTVKVYGAANQTAGATTAAACKANATPILKSSY
jgi:hypothetical protein